MRTKNTKISNAVIRRLPRYRRYLIELDKKGVDKISSQEFSELIGYTASQIRQDLNNFGEFGQQGYGYSVKGLLREINRILGLDKEYMMVLAGVGNLGKAITEYALSLPKGFKLKALFEIDPKLIGKKFEDIEILDYETIVDYVEENDIDIGIICVNPENAQDVADRLCFAGVKGIWNFSTIDIEVPGSVALENVQLSDNLHSLAYHMNDLGHREAAAKEAKAKEEVIASRGDR